MRRQRGFTLIELAVVLAIVAILAVIGFSWMRAGRRNADVASFAAGLQMRIEQLQYTALSEQVDQVLVIVDVPNNDASQCGTILSSGCARVYHLRNPDPNAPNAWKLKDFDVNAPGANLLSATSTGIGTPATIVDDDRLGQGLKFHLAGAGASLPKPFDAYASSFKVFDPNLLASCPGNRKCVAYRFRADGSVIPEPPDPTSASSTANTGHAFALGSELTGNYGGARQIGILVSSPAGIVRTFAVP
ncbi:MAG TPA: type II secretion system protein [Anaeromyxobacter sp.]